MPSRDKDSPTVNLTEKILKDLNKFERFLAAGDSNNKIDNEKKENMNNSINTAQSQAGLDFAHTADSRPTALNRAKKFILTLLALLTITTGAWAEGVTASEIDGTVSAGWRSDESLIKASDLPGYNKITLEQAETWASAPASGTVYLIYEIVADGDIKIAKFEDGNYTDSYEWEEETHYLISEHINYGGKRYFYTTGPVSSGPEVTTAADGKTATMEMPASDVTVTYELVRDMSYKVAFSGVPTRARLAKDGDGKFHFADGLTFQLLDNIDANNPKDITSAEGITFMVGEVDAVDIEGNTFYQLDKETLVPLADFLADAHLGNYAICAVASTGEYDGSFTSGTITLFQGYEVEVPAKEFITYYKDEPLYVEDTDVTLYTITAVSGDKATATEVTTAPAGMPLLVKNNSADPEKTTVLLIPTTDRTPDTGIEVYAGFTGTLEATTIAASDAATDRYALNGQQFVWVKNPVSIAANKAWLEVPTAGSNPSAARALTIVFDGDTTGISGLSGKTGLSGDWYDLNGRKLNNIPTKKGVYIFNGKKVVIK